MKNINIKNILKFTMSISLILFLILKIDYKKIDFTNPILFFFILIAIIITMLTLLLMTIRWNLLIKTFINKVASVKNLYEFYLIGMCFNVFLPGAIGGDVIRTQRLVKRYDVGVKSATMITISERILGIYGLILLLITGVFFKNFPKGIKFITTIPDWVIISSFILAISLLPVARYFLKRKDILVSVVFLFKTLIVLLVAQFGDILIAYLFSVYFHLQLSFSVFIFIMPLVYFATVLPISLGGLGIREGSFAGLMTLYGVDPSKAILISFFMYIVKVIVGVMGYFVYLKEK